MGVGFGAGLGVAGAASPLAFPFNNSGYSFMLDLTNGDSIIKSGSAVVTVQDASGNGRDFTTPVVNYRSTYRATSMLGKPCMELNNASGIGDSYQGPASLDISAGDASWLIAHAVRNYGQGSNHQYLYNQGGKIQLYWDYDSPVYNMKLRTSSFTRTLKSIPGSAWYYWTAVGGYDNSSGESFGCHSYIPGSPSAVGRTAAAQPTANSTAACIMNSTYGPSSSTKWLKLFGALLFMRWPGAVPVSDALIQEACQYMLDKYT
jgi:hypothetical protein